MRKLYSLFLAVPIMLVQQVSAQLTQANHAPAVGDTHQTWQCDSVAPGASGSGVTWNYSSLNTHSNIIVSYTSNTTNNTNYPLAAIEQSTSPSGAFYYSSSTSSLSYYGGKVAVGSGGSAIVATLYYSAPAIYASYPMVLNSAASAQISGSMNITSPITTTGTFGGSSSVKADATGTLILPGAADIFTNVIRVVLSQTVNFTTGFASGTLTQVTYDYYSNGTKAPVFSIATATAATSFGTPTQTIVTRNKTAAGTGIAPTTTIVTGDREDNLTAIRFSVYPNPSLGHINFTAQGTGASTVLIYDVTGKLVEKIKLIDGKSKLDVSSYYKGFYIYTLVADNGKTLKSGKLTVGE